MNDIEREIIILNSAWSMIDDMVNWAMFVKTDTAEPTHLIFKTSKHARLFAILLADFLSEIRAFNGDPVPLGLQAAPKNARPSDLTFLFHLRQVIVNPKLGSDLSKLHAAAEDCAKWLERMFVAESVHLHLGDTSIVVDIRISRLRYITMCGNISKHSLARLANNVGHLRKLLRDAGHPISEQQGYLAVDSFFEWFFDNIFSYHSSQIAELLNNIRWAIYEYLQPEFIRSWHLTEKATKSFPRYGYRTPREIAEPVAIAMYWEAMNRSRGPPYFPRFTIPALMKSRY